MSVSLNILSTMPAVREGSLPSTKGSAHMALFVKERGQSSVFILSHTFMRGGTTAYCCRKSQLSAAVFPQLLTLS